MRPSNLGTYAEIKLVDTISEGPDQGIGTLYEKTGEQRKHVHADYFKTVAIRENGVTALHEIHGMVDLGMFVKIS